MSKSLLTIGIMMASCLALLFAQATNQPLQNLTSPTGPVGSPGLPVTAYDGAKPPPLSLLEAYKLALTVLGEKTNQLYCVSATSLSRLSDRPVDFNLRQDHGVQGWTFTFSNTNGAAKQVDVYFHSKAAFVK